MSTAAPSAKKAKVAEADAKAKSHEAKHSEHDQQSTPGHEDEMDEKPRFEAKWYRGSGKLEGKVALITGGDSGIGRAVAVLFAREGCKVAINYLAEEQSDADETKKWVEEKERGACLLLPGDLRESKVCRGIVTNTIEHYGKLDILVNNAGVQHVVEEFTDLEEDQIVDTFRTNIIAMMLVTKEALKHLPEKTGAIINTTSVTAFRGNPKLVDYSSTKGAISAFTRSLATQLGPKGIRVNQVAPGPIWTPLIPSTFSSEHRSKWGKDTPLGRIGQPDECSPAYVFLASQDSSYFTGQTLHPNGGSVVNA